MDVMLKAVVDLNVWLVGGAYHRNSWILLAQSSAELYTHQARLRKEFEEALSKYSCGQFLNLTAEAYCSG